MSEPDSLVEAAIPIGGTKLQQFAQFTLEHVSDAVYWIRLDGSLVYVNQAACDMLGYSKDEFYSRSIFDIDPYLPAARWTPMWDALLQQGQRKFQSAHRTKDGRFLPVEICSSVFELDGEKFGCSLVRDIAERTLAEETHQREHSLIESLIETAPVLILVLDAQGRVVRFNHSAEQTTGYRFDEIQGRKWLETLVAESNRDEVGELLKQSMSGATMRGVVYAIQTKAGLLREILWHDQLLSNVGSETLGLLKIGQDVTDQRELELRLRQAEKMEAVGRLAGGVAHDFNNQLACIMGWVEILANDPSDASVVQECAERILQASRRASDLTSQLLAYSRKGKYVTRPVNLHELVNEVTGILRRSVDKRINLLVDLEAAEFHTLGDSTQLGNAILNLVLNARDAMPNGGTLAIRTTQREVDQLKAATAPHEIIPGTYIDLSVSDTGMGMDANTQRQMFEPFFTTKDEGCGIGMGLAAVYGTVKSHHGTISAQSSLGLGTSIHILLPITRIEAHGSVIPVKAELTVLGACNVMLVDDEEPVREVTSRLLSHLGCKVEDFSNGFDAIEYYRSEWSHVDVVVLDMIMPLLDGKSVYYALRQINPQVRVILASGYSLDGAAQLLLNEGVSGFIQKPFALHTLFEALSQLAGKRESLSRLHGGTGLNGADSYSE